MQAISSQDAGYQIHSRYSNEQDLLRFGWIGKIMSLPNKKFDAALKATVFGLSQEFARRGIPHSTSMKVWLPNVADASGMEERATKKHMRILMELGAIIKETKTELNKLGDKVSRVYIRFSDIFLRDPASILAEIEENKRGGRHIKKHKDCGGEIVNTCKKCGETDIPDSQTYLEEQNDPDGNISSLPTMAELDDYAPTVDAADIPDHLLEIHGPKILTMPTKQLQEASKLTRLEYEGIVEEDMAAIDAVLHPETITTTTEIETPIEDHSIAEHFEECLTPATPTKRIEILDGIKTLVGYSDRETREYHMQEARDEARKRQEQERIERETSASKKAEIEATVQPSMFDGSVKDKDKKKQRRERR